MIKCNVINLSTKISWYQETGKNYPYGDKTKKYKITTKIHLIMILTKQSCHKNKNLLPFKKGKKCANQKG